MTDSYDDFLIKENKEHLVINHLYVKDGDTEIGFVLYSDKDFVTIETENREGEKFSIEMRLIHLVTIAETLKAAAGWAK